MLHFILIAQLHTPTHVLPNASIPLVPIAVDTSTLNEQRRTEQQQALETQLRLLNQHQKDYQEETQKLYNSLPPSRVDCYPLFPPVSGYPPGSSSIACH